MAMTTKITIESTGQELSPRLREMIDRFTLEVEELLEVNYVVDDTEVI